MAAFRWGDNVSTRGDFITVLASFFPHFAKASIDRYTIGALRIPLEPEATALSLIAGF